MIRRFLLVWGILLIVLAVMECFRYRKTLKDPLRKRECKSLQRFLKYELTTSTCILYFTSSAVICGVSIVLVLVYILEGWDFVLNFINYVWNLN